MATFTLPQQSRAAGTYKVPPSNPPQIPAGSTQIAFQLNLIAADFTNTANLITYGVYSSSLPDGSDAKLEITGDWQGGARLQPQGVLSVTTAMIGRYIWGIFTLNHTMTVGMTVTLT
jgi:hypothetical protein